MRIWLLTIGEPLPSDGTAERLLRTGMLAEILATRGHDVTWWTSTFDHARKRQRFNGDATVSVGPNYSLRLIHARPYPRNICARRWLNHRKIAARFSPLASSEPQPDLILSSLPTVDLCKAALDYARPRNVPVAIDVRDLWPEVFVDLAPSWLRGPAELALSPLFAEFRAVCREARAIVGTTEEYIAYACKHALRRAKTWDQSFPLGYRRSPCTETALEAADAFWNQLGITPGSNRFTCCYFGNMGRHCTLETVIAAAKKLAHTDVSMRFVLCGTGDKLSHYRKLAAGCDSIHFPGWIDAAQIQSLMARSSVGLAPYISNTNFQNNIPNKPIEYLSAGLPIVSSLTGVLQRLIDQHQCGATYASANVQQLTSILSQLAKDPNQLHCMSANARQLYQEKFDADMVYAQMANHLEQLARSRVTTKPHFQLDCVAVKRSNFNRLASFIFKTWQNALSTSPFQHSA